MFFFFFSSRRRHTRFDCDWSSDVCSSDLDGCQVNGLRPISHRLHLEISSSQLGQEKSAHLCIILDTEDTSFFLYSRHSVFLVYLSPGCICSGQDECKNCALPWITLQSKRAAMGLDDTPADIQP